ncbi:MAG: universal stress protein [Rhizobacter sp.]|nr:universal stress protein [Rhizobacter sp.]
MSSIRNLLLHLDASPHSATRLALARQLAQAHGASIHGLYAVSSNFVEMPFAMAESSEAGAIVLKLDAERRDRALALFERANRDGTPAATWSELGTEPVIWGFTQRAYYCDMLVLGQHEPGSPTARDLPSDFIESVVLGSGKPALVVPYAGDSKTFAQNILVAWSPSRESARALSAAMPLLQKAGQVHVVTWTDPQSAPQAASDRALLEQHLALHDVKATLHWYGNGHGEPGDRLLSLTADLGSDLLVMGCYGHSRARELVLGGATRTVLRSMTLPVLMAH